MLDILANLCDDTTALEPNLFGAVIQDSEGD